MHVASFSPGLVASGLFGHERGAFTGATEQAKGRFELADGGTLFLDEVGELTAEDQVRLLRVLQEGTFERVGGTRPIRSDFRLVAATNRDLQAEVRAGRFREDLYFRLAGFPLRVPPLRERREEIPTLALFFMERASRARGVRFEGIGEADMQRMLEYPWPGNVRELEHVDRARRRPLRAAAAAHPGARRGDAPARAVRLAAAPRRRARAELVTLAEAERRHIAQRAPPRARADHRRGRRGRDPRDEALHAQLPDPQARAGGRGQAVAGERPAHHLTVPPRGANPPSLGRGEARWRTRDYREARGGCSMLSQAHFTAMLPVTDVSRARRFYEGQLGLRPKDALPSGEVLFESDGGTFALYPRPTPPRSDHTQLTWEVPDLRAEMTELRSRGVRFEEYPELNTRDGVADMNGEKAAWFKDPDGNILCLHEPRH